MAGYRTQKYPPHFIRENILNRGAGEKQKGYQRQEKSYKAGGQWTMLRKGLATMVCIYVVEAWEGDGYNGITLVGLRLLYHAKSGDNVPC